MATVAHHIRSEYDPDVDRDRLLRETGQTTTDSDIDVDPWQKESSSASFHNSHRLANAPKFVPALLSTDEWGTPTSAELTLVPSDSPHGGDVATWYKSLTWQGATPKQQQSQSRRPSHDDNVTRYPNLVATPEPSTSPPSPSITAPASSTSTAWATATTPSSSRLAPQRRHRRGRDWFISRAIAQSASTPQLNVSDSSSSLADILSRHPPSAQPFRPPVFLHLDPSNKGWAMLQSQGWSEGEGLGAGSRGRSSNNAHAKTIKEEEKKKTKRMRLDSPFQEQATEEVRVDDDDEDDPIIEVRKKVPVPMIDLTQSDTEDDEEEDSDDDMDETDSSSSAPPVSSEPGPLETTTADPRAAQTALLTPLPTTLKSDRLGIGLKAKTEGPYRSSVKRVTHNAAALAAHLEAAEDMRRTQRQLGKGHRAFARAEHVEREQRQNMMVYLSEP